MCQEARSRVHVEYRCLGKLFPSPLLSGCSSEDLPVSIRFLLWSVPGNIFNSFYIECGKVMIEGYIQNKNSGKEVKDAQSYFRHSEFWIVK